MPIDWDKPIQLEDGQECLLLETNPEGWTQWGARSDGAYPTRCIHRVGEDISTPAGHIASRWWVHEDGVTGWPGLNVINVPDAESVE